MLRIVTALAIVAFSATVLPAQQQLDMAKLAPMLQLQRDAANNQIAALLAQLQDVGEKMKALEVENAALKAKLPPEK
jgi:hypothetical protein